MTEPFKFRHLNRLVGAFLIGSTAILMASVVIFGRADRWFEKHFTATVRFDRSNLGLLRSGLPVKIQGIEAGEVVVARPAGDGTLVELQVRDAFREQLRGDARAILHTPIAGIFGETFIEILPGASEIPFNPTTDTMAQEPGDDLVAQARGAIIAIGGAATQLREVLAENRKEVAAAVAGVRRTADQTAALVEENREALRGTLTRLDHLSQQVDTLVTTSAPHLSASAERLPQVLDGVQTTTAAVGRTAEASATAAAAIAGAATAMGRTADSATAVLDANQVKITESLDELASLLQRADAIATDLEKVSAKVAAGEGSLGKFVMADTAHDTAIKAIETLQKRMDELEPVISSIGHLRLFIGVEGGHDARSGSSTGGVYLRLEPRSWKFYEGGLTYRTASEDVEAEVEADTVVPVDFSILLGWRFFEAEAKDRHHLSLAVGLIETRPGLRVDVPLGTRHLVWRTLARWKHDNRNLDDRRYEEGHVLVRSTLDAWIWPDHIALTAGGNDLGDQPGAWFGLRGELQDNDLKNITQVSALFR